ncbi:MAG: hydroxyquinol 1,2-dioxygenase [Rhodospirillaceae bacterium]|nr:hydroxyquinol 1,2-dioxygenase [Rhodospirillaceae bacterium]
MKDLTLDNMTDVVISSIADTEDPRLKEVLSIVIRKIHEAAIEVQITHAEWEGLMNFLLAAGNISDAQRNEFILLSDLTGLTSLVDLIASSSSPDASERSVLGPFYVPNAPMIESGGDLIADNEGDPVVALGRVLSSTGEPIPGAMMEFWQNAANGQYSNVDPTQDDNNLRCRMLSNDDGSYEVSTIRPIAYEVPDDGPGGEYMRATGRHCWRPAHLHVRVHADGYEDLVTEVFNTLDKYIEEDAVFGVRSSLAIPFNREPTPDEQARFSHVASPFHMVDFDFVLQPLG